MINLGTRSRHHDKAIAEEQSIAVTIVVRLRIFTRNHLAAMLWEERLRFATGV